MKPRHLIIVIGVIILVHLIVILACFSGGGSSSPAGQDDKTVSSTSYSYISAARKKVAAENTEKADNTVSAVAEKEPEPAKEKHILDLKFPALRYTHALSGNIPEIPESAGARAGILVDADTGTVLWEKNGRKAFPIASMTKIMTSLIAYETILNAGSNLSLQTSVPVTAAAQKIGGSQVWLDVRESFTLEELLLAVAVKSANDAAYLVAEYLGGGDVSTFVHRMNVRAKELGMLHSRFCNPHGLPGSSSFQDNVSSPEDMVILAEQSLRYPKLMEWASTVTADFRKPGVKGHLKIVNHNNLLPGRRYPAIGVDGLKTGFINRSGYCVTVTCKRNNKRLIAVVVGFDSARNRDLFVKKLLNWGYPRTEDPASALVQSRKKAAEIAVRKKTVKSAKSGRKKPASRTNKKRKK